MSNKYKVVPAGDPNYTYSSGQYNPANWRPTWNAYIPVPINCTGYYEFEKFERIQNTITTAVYKQVNGPCRLRSYGILFNNPYNECAWVITDGPYKEVNDYYSFFGSQYVGTTVATNLSKYEPISYRHGTYTYLGINATGVVAIHFNGTLADGNDEYNPPVDALPDNGPSGSTQSSNIHDVAYPIKWSTSTNRGEGRVTTSAGVTGKTDHNTENPVIQTKSTEDWETKLTNDFDDVNRYGR